MKHDLAGRSFGKLTVLREAGMNADRRVLWQCLCECGTEKPVASALLVRGDAVSCGCKRAEAKDPKARIQALVAVLGSGCWEWTGSKDRGGYGRLKVQLGAREAFRFTSAHRYAWEMYSGEIPHGLQVLHRCDNPSCCNPDHLFLGTQSDNMRDMYAKGRGPKGYKRDSSTCKANAMKRAAIDAARGKT